MQASRWTLSGELAVHPRDPHDTGGRRRRSGTGGTLRAVHPRDPHDTGGRRRRSGTGGTLRSCYVVGVDRSSGRHAERYAPRLPSRRIKAMSRATLNPSLQVRTVDESLLTTVTGVSAIENP